MAKYNGHRSWNAWNVALWIGNDEGLYSAAVDAIAEPRSKQMTFEQVDQRRERQLVRLEADWKAGKLSSLDYHETKDAIEHEAYEAIRVIRQRNGE